MSCSEVRSLLTLRSLDLLEEAERSSVEEHLASCAPCRLEVGSAGEVASYLMSARRDERPPERVWDAVAARLEPNPRASDTSASPRASEASREGVLLQLACATCSGGLVEGGAVYCSSCLAPHHAECFTKCTVHGCSGTTLVSARAPRRSMAGPLVLVGIAAVSAIVVVQRAYDELLDETRRNTQLENDIKKFIIVKKPEPVAPVAKPRDRVDVSSDGVEELSVALDRVGKAVDQNIVVAPDVHVKMKFDLRNVHWRDAVSAIASLAKCDIVQRGDVLVLMKPITLPERVEPVPLPPADEPEKDIEFKLNGFVVVAGQPSSAVINGKPYREGDQIVGRDGKPFSPRRFVAKIHTDGVEIATGSLDGPRTVLGR